MDGAYCIDPLDLPDDEEEPDCKDLSWYRNFLIYGVILQTYEPQRQ